MGLADRLAVAEPRRSYTAGRCIICEWYAQLGETDRAEFDRWIAAGRSRAQLYRHCVDEGLDASEAAFQACIRKQHRAAS
ncbi:hypothetical protein DS6A_35 [Mycobacterium phage DS6A]|uniref:Uncharacterized protein n=1 Tax=Mycobacterium phage DS6A TaxID=45764 RepID=G8I4E5_9CAUD|nr:hypothetical protein DS6A_35 [Mycobacterium phage DS6A]AER47589.1 hypothetical protein DS6A_35 [Mycobacterium phage DS6A]